MKLRTRGRFNVKRVGRLVADRVRGDALDRAIAGASEGANFVFGWNRGLGDIALGLCPLFARIRARRPAASITVFTRADLVDALHLTDADRIVAIPGLARGEPVDLDAAAARTGECIADGAVRFADPDPTRWLEGQRTEHPPVLRWDPAWDARADELLAARTDVVTIGAHVASETARYYGYVKDWPPAHWRALFARFADAARVRWVLFGHAADADYTQANVCDLRGRTGFLDLLAVVRTRCRLLVAPDSGVLTMAYYLAGDRPLDVISLWSDPRQGVLKQGCSSPNPRLAHTPLVGRDEDVRNLTVDAVADAVSAALARAA